MGSPLLMQRRFAPFFATQGLGALNDNIFKTALLLLLAYRWPDLGLSTDVLLNIGAGLFILPFLLFSAQAGHWLEYVEKARYIRWVKAMEILVMALAALGFYLQSPWLLLGVLFLMGTQSAFFGPVKYAIMPSLVNRHELLFANGLVEMATFLAILCGQVGGALLVLHPDLWPIGVTVLLVAVLGSLSSQFIPTIPNRKPQHDQQWQPIRCTFKLIKFVYAQRMVFYTLLAISWFWFFGAVYLTQLPTLTRDYIGGDEGVFTLLLATFSIGIGIGSLACSRVLKRAQYRLCYASSIAMTLLTWLLCLLVGAPEPELMGLEAFIQQAESWFILVTLCALGVVAGFYVVPLYTFVQLYSIPDILGRIIACNNVLNAFFMVCAAILGASLLGHGLSVPVWLAVCATMNLAALVIWHKQVFAQYKFRNALRKLFFLSRA